MSAPVTEAHRELARTIRLHLTLGQAYQVIADSEARATAQANAQVESLISSAKNAIPASEHPAEPTVENWAWQIRNLGDDRRLVYAERDQLRAECLNLRADLDAIKAIRDEEKARADEAEHDCRDLIGQLNDALAELDGIRALAGRNKRYCFKDTARELVAALDQALDIAQAELKAEQDIRVINEIELKVSRAIVSKIWTQLGSPTYEQLKGRSIYHLIDELKAELATERARLEEMAAELAHCAGYIASVRTDRQITWHEELYALQTVEWAEGAVEIAEKANAVLEAHDAAMKEDRT